MVDRRSQDEGRVLAGSGSPDGTSVEQRARELALIEHPESPEVTEQDRERARHELRGTGIPTSMEGEPNALRAVSRDPSDPPEPVANVEREVKPEDPQKEVESAVLEGVREAEHQTMLAARRAEDEQVENEEEEEEDTRR